MKRGDVVLIVAPGDLGKPRPGTIVQTDELSDTTTVLVCPLTSDLERTTRIRPLVQPSAENGLRLPSQIMTDKMLPVRRDRVRRVLGTFDAETRDRLDRALMIVLGLAQ